MLACFRQPLHPSASFPQPGFGCRQGSKQEGRAAKVPQLLSHHPHVAAHEQLCEQPASSPDIFQGEQMPPPTFKA